jgi:hypothetical protein
MKFKIEPKLQYLLPGSLNKITLSLFSVDNPYLQEHREKG